MTEPKSQASTQLRVSYHVHLYRRVVDTRSWLCRLPVAEVQKVLLSSGSSAAKSAKPSITANASIAAQSAHTAHTAYAAEQTKSTTKARISAAEDVGRADKR